VRSGEADARSGLALALALAALVVTGGAGATPPALGAPDGGFSAVPEAEPNDDRANATRLAPGGTATGSVDGDDTRDYYAVEVERGETLFVRLETGPHEKRSSVEIDAKRPSEDGPVYRTIEGERVNDSGVAADAVTVRRSGTILVQAVGRPGSDRRPYRLTVRAERTDPFEPNERAATAADLSGEGVTVTRENGTLDRATVNGSIVGNDADWFGTVTVPNGSRLVLTLDHDGGEGGLVVRGVTEGPHLAGASPNARPNGSARLVLRARGTCRLRIAVAPFQQAFADGNYTLTLRVVDGETPDNGTAERTPSGNATNGTANATAGPPTLTDTVRCGDRPDRYIDPPSGDDDGGSSGVGVALLLGLIALVYLLPVAVVLALVALVVALVVAGGYWLLSGDAEAEEVAANDEGGANEDDEDPWV
jgi:hypothetical protein